MLKADSETDWSKVNLEALPPGSWQRFLVAMISFPIWPAARSPTLRQIKGREPTLDRGQSRLASDIAGMISERADCGWRSLHAFARDALWNRSSSKMRKRLTS